MDDLHWPRVPREPGVLKIDSNMVSRFFQDFCNVDKVSRGINTSESKNSTIPCSVDAGHEPIKSTATSSKEHQ